MIRILGIDPGLRITGWGVIDFDGFRLKYVAHGTITPPTAEEIAYRLSRIFKELSNVIEEYAPNEVGIEQVFVNSNNASSLKLGMARGVAICAPGIAGLKVSEYAPDKIKKTVTGNGRATKDQVSVMARRLLPPCPPVKLDAADALAIAICHAHHRGAARYEK